MLKTTIWYKKNMHDLHNKAGGHDQLLSFFTCNIVKWAFGYPVMHPMKSDLSC